MPPHASPQVGIVVLNWNGRDDAVRCVASLLKLNYDNYRIVVVDNGSTDGSAETLRRQFSQITVLDAGTNLGSSGGNNLGLRYVLDRGADFFFLINNDAEPDSEALNAYVRSAAEHPEAGLFTGKIYYWAPQSRNAAIGGPCDQPNRFWFAGGRLIRWKAFVWVEGIGQVDDGRTWEQDHETDWVCGCSLFGRAEVARKVGLQDPRYFVYWEEVDWSERARRAGFKSWFVPQAKVYHRVTSIASRLGTKKFFVYYQFRNRLLWIEDHLPWPLKLTAYLWILVQGASFVLRALRGGRRGQSGVKRAATYAPNERSGVLIRARLMALRDYVLRRFGPGPAWLYTGSQSRNAANGGPGREPPAGPCSPPQT